MSVRKLCVHSDRDGHPVTVDVVLPSGAPVAELLPAILDMVDGRSPPDGAALRWRLERPSGGTLDESMSLMENAIEDGELLVLSQVQAPALGAVRMEPGHAAVVTHLPGVDIAQRLPAIFCISAILLASVALACTAGSAHAMTNVMVAAVGACAAAAVSMATDYGTAPNVTTVCLASATGFLAVPSAPAVPNVFLAATAGLSASLLMLRLSGRVSPTLTASAALSLLTALMTLVPLPVVAVGAALSCASLGLLAIAPRLSVLAVRLGSAQGNGDVADRAGAAHAILSGLVVGGAAGSASGAVVLAAGGAAATLGALAFTALFAVVLLLRSRTYVDAVRQITLGAAGFTSGGACLWLVLNSHPEYVGVAGGLLVATGLLAVRRPRLGDFAARVVDRCEYAALAAVAPVACWVSGVYGIVNGIHL